jgi:dTMP kinase
MRNLLIFLLSIFFTIPLLAKGRLIEICGIDGAGKTTLASDIAQALNAKGRKAIVLKPISGNPLIYKLLDELDILKNATEHESVSQRIDRFKNDYFFLTFLNQKDRINHLMEDDYDVICDRYIFSFKTYQECFDQLTYEDEVLFTELPKADMTCLITVSVDLAVSRIEERGNPASYENPVFLQRAREIFLRDANSWENLMHLDGTNSRELNTKNVLLMLETGNDSKG